MPLVLRTSNLPQRIKTTPSPPPCESQHESDEEEQVPDSPDSVESDASTGSWSKMSQISRGPPAIRRHPEYYIDSGDVVFQVENYLFKVHRYFFVRESQKFKDMLRAPSQSRNTATQIGSSDAYPVELRDVTAKEFCRFLWVFYNPDYTYTASASKWSSILRLAHLWSFPKVKDLAVREMDQLGDSVISPVDKAVMAREYEVDPKRRWLETAYAALGARERPLTKEEGTRLGLDAVLLLAEVRERIRARRRKEREMKEKEEREAKKRERENQRWAFPPIPASFGVPQQQHQDVSSPPAGNGSTIRHVQDGTPYESRPPSPAGSDCSYDPQLAQSTYLPPLPPPAGPGSPTQVPQYTSNPGRNETGYGFGYSSGSVNGSTTGSKLGNYSNSSSSSNVNRPHYLTTPSRSYTEDDVADVRSVFAL